MGTRRPDVIWPDLLSCFRSEIAFRVLLFASLKSAWRISFNASFCSFTSLFSCFSSESDMGIAANVAMMDFDSSEIGSFERDGDFDGSLDRAGD